jgi:hypothetical protein
LVDSHKLDYDDKESYEKCIKILNKVLELINSTKSKRNNKTNTLAYIEAMFNYELAEITCDGVLKGKLNDNEIISRQKLTKRIDKFNSMNPNLFKKLSKVCEVH